MLKDGAENAIPYPETLGLRPLLHHQYPTPRWYHRMPPQLLSQPLSTHPMLSANPARACQAVAILSGYLRQTHKATPQEMKLCPCQAVTLQAVLCGCVAVPSTYGV